MKRKPQHHITMKNIRAYLLFTTLFLFSKESKAQFCFFDSTTTLHYNGSQDGAYDITSADFNKDGHLDVVTANSVSRSISFIPGNGQGTLGIPDTIPVGSVLFCITSADFDKDGKMDIATAGGGTVYVMNGNGDGTFQPPVLYTTGGGESRIYARDINMDNITDLVEATESGLYILIGQSTGLFQPPVKYNTGGSVYDAAIADFDNDGSLDIVTTTRINLTTAVLSFLKGNGAGGFAVPVSIPVPHFGIFGINSEDIDNDGNADLIVSNSHVATHRMEIYKGNGDGTFAAPVYYPMNSGPTYVYLADMDNDLIKDIIVVENSGFSVLKLKNDGTMFPYQFFLGMPQPNGIAIGDFDENGKRDVIIPSGYFQTPTIGIDLNCSTTTGISEQTLKNQMDIFPNPCNTVLTITTTSKTGKIEIFDLLGTRKIIRNCEDDKTTINIEALSQGNYLLVYRQGEVIFHRQITRL